MIYEVVLTETSQIFLKKCSQELRQRITKKFEALAEYPELGKPMVGKLAGLWSLRIGKYRALYQIQRGQLIILVLKIDHRKDIYD